MSKKVIVAVTNDLVTDQRVDRSCMALTEAGYEVTLVGRRLSDSVPLYPRPYRTRRMSLLFNRKAFFYAEYNCRLFFRLLFSDADLFYANDIDTLPACYLAARWRHKRLFFDAHEMFPEVPELVDRPRVKHFWERIERWILPKIGTVVTGAACTVCESIAKVYRDRYGIQMVVVRNVPSDVQMPDANNDDVVKVPDDKSFVLYQGAVNVGRGIEWVIDAMEFVNDCRFVVAGVGDIYQKMRDYASAKPWQERIVFLGRVEPRQLKQLTSKAALGVVLLENRGLNYYYSLPNRIGDFVQAGVPIVASDFPEIKKIVETYPIGTLVAADCCGKMDAKSLATVISKTIGEWSVLSSEDRTRRFDEARRNLSWDGHDKFVLVAAVNTIFSEILS